MPEPRDLRRFVSRPPPGSGRLHCTMLRHAGEPAPCYTLYLEYLGGLVPLLKGRRTSKIRPEFVIFDPQTTDTLNVPDYTSQYPSFSDCSDNEKSTAELCGSPRMNKRKSRRRRDDKYNEENDDLAYVDTLPEVTNDIFLFPFFVIFVEQTLFNTTFITERKISRSNFQHLGHKVQNSRCGRLYPSELGRSHLQDFVVAHAAQADVPCNNRAQRRSTCW